MRKKGLQWAGRRCIRAAVRAIHSNLLEVIYMEEEKVLVELLPEEAIVERESLVPT